MLFVPSVERDGSTAIDQNQWVNAALERLGRTFGGATAYPKAKGIWRDDERGGALGRAGRRPLLHDARRHRGRRKPRRARELLPEHGARATSTSRFAISGRKGITVEPMQLAALLLEKTTERLSEEEVGEVVRRRRRASR